MDNNQLAVNVFNKHAQAYQDKYMDVSLYHPFLDEFCSSIKKGNARVLELACGPGNITRYLLTQRPNLKIKGVDLAPKMVELAKNNNPNAEFLCMDCRAIGKMPEKYDAIMVGFLLPYLSKEESLCLIGDAAKLLEKGGILYLSTMEDDYGKSGPQTSSSGDQLYMYFHQADYLTDALLSNGFKILQLIRQDFPINGGETLTDLIIIAQSTTVS